MLNYIQKKCANTDFENYIDFSQSLHLFILCCWGEYIKELVKCEKRLPIVHARDLSHWLCTSLKRLFFCTSSAPFFFSTYFIFVCCGYGQRIKTMCKSKDRRAMIPVTFKKWKNSLCVCVCFHKDMIGS